MNINIKDAKRKYHFDYTVSNDNFKIDKDVTGRIVDKLNVTGYVEKLVNDQLLINLNLTGAIAYPCSRCLEEVIEDVDYHYDEEFEMNNDGVVELDNYINDCLFVNEPIKILCDENCKGLCPVCGMNLNTGSCHCAEEEEIDPRLEKLKSLL